MSYYSSLWVIQEYELGYFSSTLTEAVVLQTACALFASQNILN